MKKKLLLIDNYDSFTYNLVQYFQELGVEVIVKRNDQITAAAAKNLAPDYLVFSPGPGTCEVASDIGVSEDLFHVFRGVIPILGVCLGHQLMGKIFGGQIKRVAPAHGKRYPIKVTDKAAVLFQNLPATIEVMRYHSLVVDFTQYLATHDTVPLTITALTADEDRLIMAMEKPTEKLYGVQFHPESIGTPSGKIMLQNFLDSDQ
jgi:anthranilate synthase component 2